MSILTMGKFETFQNQVEYFHSFKTQLRYFHKLKKTMFNYRLKIFQNQMGLSPLSYILRPPVVTEILFKD